MSKNNKSYSKNPLSAVYGGLCLPGCVDSQLEILGEAAGQLSSEFCATHPSIKVSRMKGLRNVLAHQYFAVDLKLVWKIAVYDVPELMASISQCIHEDCSTPSD